MVKSGWCGGGNAQAVLRVTLPVPARAPSFALKDHLRPSLKTGHVQAKACLNSVQAGRRNATARSDGGGRLPWACLFTTSGKPGEARRKSLFC